MEAVRNPINMQNKVHLVFLGGFLMVLVRTCCLFIFVLVFGESKVTVANCTG